MVDLIYKQECFEIIGCCYEVFDQVGPGLRENNYQRALEEVFKLKNINFESQLFIPLKIGDKTVGKYYLDFLVDEKIAIELKVGELFRRKDIEQLKNYLKPRKLKLGIIINFTSSGVNFKRILNLY